MLISLYVSWIQRDGTIGVIDGLIRFLEILRIDKSELAVRIGIVRICFNCVLQNVDGLRKIILPLVQFRKFRLTRIDIEHFAICL